MDSEKVNQEVIRLKALAQQIFNEDVTAVVNLQSKVGKYIVHVQQTAYRDFQYGPLKLQYEVQVTPK